MASDYRYCPHCSTPLTHRSVFGHERPVCPECGFIQFKDPKVAVIGLVTSRDRVLLIRRGVDPEKGMWALPGGYMDAGEMPDEALTRELVEEVGLDIEVGHLLDIYPMTTTSRVVGGIVLAYYCRPIGDGLPALVTEDDVDMAGWFAADELPECIAFTSSRDLLESWQTGDLGDGHDAPNGTKWKEL